MSKTGVNQSGPGVGEGKGPEPGEQGYMDPMTRVVLGLAIFFSGLVGVVVVVGLVQGKLDPTGIATMLGGIVTGIMGGLFLRWKSTDGE